MRPNLWLKFIVCSALLAIIVAFPAPSTNAQASDCLGICDLEWSPTDENLLAAIDESGLWLSDVSDVDVAPTLYEIENPTSLSFNPDGSSIAVTSCTGSEPNLCGGTVSIFDVLSRTWEHVISYDFTIEDALFAPNGDYIVVRKNEVRAWGLQFIHIEDASRNFVIVDEMYTNVISSIAFDDEGKYVAIANGSRRLLEENFNGISIWNVSNQEMIASTPSIEAFYVRDVLFSADESEIIFAQIDASVTKWNYDLNRFEIMLNTIDTIPDILHYIDLFSHDGLPYIVANLYVGQAEREFVVRNLSSNDERFTRRELGFSNLATINNSLEYYAWAATVSDERVIGIWNLFTGESREVSLE